MKAGPDDAVELAEALNHADGGVVDRVKSFENRNQNDDADDEKKDQQKVFRDSMNE